jgi:hypothetical protein
MKKRLPLWQAEAGIGRQFRDSPMKIMECMKKTDEKPTVSIHPLLLLSGGG